MKTDLDNIEFSAESVHGTTRYVLFHDARDNRTLDSLKISNGNAVVKNFAIGSVWELPDRLKQDMSCLKELDFDAVIVDPEETNIYVENILYNLRRLKVNKPVYITRSGKRGLPVMTQVIGGGDITLNPEVFMRFPNAAVAPFLNNVEVNITDNCNLNCKACNHFSPFVKGRLKNSAERFEQDLTKLLSVYKINKLVLLGGEPLLEPELLKQFVEISRKFRDRYEMLIVITNGLLIPSLKDDFLQFLKENQVHVSVTLYPPTLALKSEIEEVLRKHDMWYVISRPVHEFMKRLSFTPTDKPQFNSDICLSNGCYHLRDGYIYKCPDSFTIKYMDAVAGTDFAEKGDAIPLDFVVANPVATMDELHGSIELCKFCGDTFLKIIPWERVDGKPDIKSWFVE